VEADEGLSGEKSVRIGPFDSTKKVVAASEEDIHPRNLPVLELQSAKDKAKVTRGCPSSPKWDGINWNSNSNAVGTCINYLAGKEGEVEIFFRGGGGKPKKLPKPGLLHAHCAGM